MNKDTETLKGLLKQVEQLYWNLYDHLSESENRITSQIVDVEDQVDIGFLCKEIETQCEHVRKAAKARRELCEKIICLELVKDTMNGGDRFKDGLCRGSLASASPDAGQIPDVPKAGTADYDALMEYLGVGKEASPIIKPSWTELCKHVNKLIADGQPLPPGITRTWPRFTTIFRRRNSHHVDAG